MKGLIRGMLVLILFRPRGLQGQERFAEGLLEGIPLAFLGDLSAPVAVGGALLLCGSAAVIWILVRALRRRTVGGGGPTFLFESGAGEGKDEAFPSVAPGRHTFSNVDAAPEEDRAGQGGNSRPHPWRGGSDAAERRAADLEERTRINPHQRPEFSPELRSGARAEPQRASRSATGSAGVSWPEARTEHGVPRPGLHSPEEGFGEVDQTLQLLPGRLEVVTGYPDREVRFVRRPGGTRFTFGRSRGPEHEHIRILAPTVSRVHAFMDYEEGRWRIGNLSATNGIVVDDEVLADVEEARFLSDGDRIEMGEVVFIFHER